MSNSVAGGRAPTRDFTTISILLHILVVVNFELLRKNCLSHILEKYIALGLR